MREKNQNKKKKKNKFRRTLTPVLLALILVITFSAALSIYFTQEDKIQELEKEKEELLLKKEETQRKKDELEKILQNWNTPEYIQKMAREEFGLVKSGETIFIE